MKKIIKLLFLIVILTTVASSCKHSEDEGKEENIILCLKIFKSDESIACVENSGIKLEIMEQELIDIGIDVICSQTANDGETRPAECNIETGGINVYTINSSNLDDAKNLGFSQVDELPKYQDEECK